VDNSSARIPAVSFVITANMPVRYHQKNEMKSSIPPFLSDLPILPVQARSKEGAIHSRSLLQLIRNCKKEH